VGNNRIHFCYGLPSSGSLSALTATVLNSSGLSQQVAMVGNRQLLLLVKVEECFQRILQSSLRKFRTVFLHSVYYFEPILLTESSLKMHIYVFKGRMSIHLGSEDVRVKIQSNSEQNEPNNTSRNNYPYRALFEVGEFSFSQLLHTGIPVDPTPLPFWEITVVKV
jgi:hypothetical protein